MKYTIDWCEVKRTGEGAKGPWTITEMNLRDEEGKVTEKVSTFDTVTNGGTIEGEIYTNDKGYLNFKKAQAVARSNFGAQQKEASITKMQDRKAESIEKAQDRSAWMWAKTNASTLLGTRLSNETNEKIASEVIDLATKIYNGELTEPFS